MAIAWTNHTHGRGPGFRSRRTLRLVRARKGSTTPARARSYELTSADLEVPEYTDRPIIRPIAPWHVRMWRAVRYYFAGGRLPRSSSR